MMRLFPALLALLALLPCAAASASLTLLGVGGAAAGGAAPTPQMIQYVASSALIAPVGLTGNNWKIPLPDPAQAGDALFLCFTYDASRTVSSVTDTLSQTWSAAATATGGTGNFKASCYYFPNTAAGALTATVALSGTSDTFNYVIGELNNIATSAPLNGTLTGATLSPNTSTYVISPGAFTPGANADGNVIINYTPLSQSYAGTQVVTLWSPANSYTLLDGDIAWTDFGGSGYGFPYGAQWYFQATPAATTPSMTSQGDNSDTFNSVSFALKVAPAGGTVPSGITINHIIHATNENFGSNTTWTLQEPVIGNLRVIEGPFDVATVTSVTDSDGNTWTKAGNNGLIYYYFKTGTTIEPNYKVTIHFSGATPTLSLRFLDISNATAFDLVADTTSLTCNSTSIANAPDITPATAPGLVIAGMSIGTGPGLSVTAPTGAVWDLVTYTGETDIDTMENADALGHFHNASTAAENWSWTKASTSTNCTAEAAAFH